MKLFIKLPFHGNTWKTNYIYIENHDYTHYNGYVAVVVFYLLGCFRHPPNLQVCQHVQVAAIIKFILNKYYDTTTYGNNQHFKYRFAFPLTSQLNRILATYLPVVQDAWHFSSHSC